MREGEDTKIKLVRLIEGVATMFAFATVVVVLAFVADRSAARRFWHAKDTMDLVVYFSSRRR